jgi:hypothetical protein
MAITSADLTTMSQVELDGLFFAAVPIGDIPDGDARGTAIVAPGTSVTGSIDQLSFTGITASTNPPGRGN